MPKGDNKINGLTMTEIELKPYPNNPRIISEQAKERLGKSMQEFGDLSGIVLNQADGYLISGHQRVNSLIERYGEYQINIIETLSDGEQRGFVEPEHIAFRVVNWEDGKASAARLAANKLGGEWDMSKLDEELQKLQDLDIDIDLTGFEIYEENFKRPEIENYADLIENLGEKEKGKCKEDGNWFYVEFYGEDAKFKELQIKLKDVMNGDSKRQIESNFFYNLVLGK